MHVIHACDCHPEHSFNTQFSSQPSKKGIFWWQSGQKRTFKMFCSVRCSRDVSLLSNWMEVSGTFFHFGAAGMHALPRESNYVSVIEAEDWEKDLFLFPALAEDWRRILNLPLLNVSTGHLPHTDMKEAIGAGSVRQSVHGYRLDAYCHRLVAPAHRNFLCFAFQSLAYEYNHSSLP